MNQEQNGKPKKGRPRTRDYRKELEDLKRYCEIMLDLLESWLTVESDNTLATQWKGQAAALKAVLARMEQK